MKVGVYAISKNESQFAERWYNSMREADEIVVLDTGSTDSTVEILRSCGVAVREQVISPWRFDVARNASLDLVSDDVDICVCTDLDEYFEPGWRARLEQAWSPATTRARYRYTWNFNLDGSEGVVYLMDKAHARRGYRWIHPVHEVLKRDSEEHIVTVPGIQLNHTAVPKNSRVGYLPLLIQAVQEAPDNDRNTHYLGREYMFQGQYEEAIITLKKHLTLKTATWDAERAASMRFIARCYKALDEYDQCELWYNRAIAEAPQYREAWVEMEQFMYDRKRWRECVFYGLQAINIKNRELSYITEPFAWGGLPHDLLSIALWQMGRSAEAICAARVALTHNPDDQRIQRNLVLMKGDTQ